MKSNQKKTPTFVVVNMHSLFELRHVPIQTKIEFLNTHKTIIDWTFGLFEKKIFKKN
jgi:hypothetical protein